MKIKNQKSRKGILLAGCVFLFGAVAGAVFLLWFGYRIHSIPSDGVREADFEALSQESYDGVLLSMYTPEAFDAWDFEHFLGTPAVQAFHTFQNLADIGDYLDQCFSCNSSLSFVYIGLDPYAVSSLYGNHASLYIRDYDSFLTDCVLAHPDTDFDILLPGYSLEYLHSLSDREYEELIIACRNLVNLYIPYDNVFIYFVGYEEWLIANPGNYDSAKACNSSVLHNILAYTIRDDHYVLKADNMEERFARMTELVKDSPADYPDLSQWCMVFFGDSILEYNAGSYSVTGVVEGLSGAQVYNCSQGGTPAAETSDAILSFNRMVTRFLEQNPAGLEEINYARELIEYTQEGHEGKKYCFLLNFGLNDYFGGQPVDNPEDNYDLGTYAGALRAGISVLKDAYPDAEILLLVPTYTSYFSEGKERNSEEGGILTDYVDVAIRVAEEMDVRSINNYADSGIKGDTWTKYLADGCHPNEAGAFLLGNRILEGMREVIADEEG